MAQARCTLGTQRYTYTHSGCVLIIASPQQQWLHERASMLRYMYIACLVIFPERARAFNKEVVICLRHAFLQSASQGFISKGYRVEFRCQGKGKVVKASKEYFTTFTRCFLTSARRRRGGGAGHSCSAGDMECAVSLSANHCGGGKQAGPVDIYTFPSRARAPVFAYTNLYLYYTRKNFFFSSFYEFTEVRICTQRYANS